MDWAGGRGGSGFGSGGNDREGLGRGGFWRYGGLGGVGGAGRSGTGVLALEEEIEVGDFLSEDVDLFGLLIEHLPDGLEIVALGAAAGVRGRLREGRERGAAK
jgi:hypothetical protein